MSTTIYLYIKIHNKTGLKYLGKTTKKDPHKYKGSGVYWLKHIKKYGYDVTTKILFITNDKAEFEKIALQYSYIYNIVKSEDWANLCEETGKGATLPGSKNGMYGKTHTQETRLIISRKKTGLHKGKTYEQIYGTKKAEELRKIRSERCKTLDNSGSNNPRYDKTTYKFYNNITEEEYVGTRYDFQNQYGLLKSGVHKLIHQKDYVYRDWTILL